MFRKLLIGSLLLAAAARSQPCTNCPSWVTNLKDKPFVDPRTYGAKCNAVQDINTGAWTGTDDVAAFNTIRALTTPREIYIPKELTCIDSGLTTISAGGSSGVGSRHTYVGPGKIVTSSGWTLGNAFTYIPGSPNRNEYGNGDFAEDTRYVKAQQVSILPAHTGHVNTTSSTKTVTWVDGDAFSVAWFKGMQVLIGNTVYHIDTPCTGLCTSFTVQETVSSLTGAYYSTATSSVADLPYYNAPTSLQANYSTMYLNDGNSGWTSTIYQICPSSTSLIYVYDTGNYSVGQTIRIGTDQYKETKVIASIQPNTSLTISGTLANNHAIGEEIATGARTGFGNFFLNTIQNSHGDSWGLFLQGFLNSAPYDANRGLALGTNGPSQNANYSALTGYIEHQDMAQVATGVGFQFIGTDGSGESWIGSTNPFFSQMQNDAWAGFVTCNGHTCTYKTTSSGGKFHPGMPGKGIALYDQSTLTDPLNPTSGFRYLDTVATGGVSLCGGTRSLFCTSLTLVTGVPTSDKVYYYNVLETDYYGTSWTHSWALSTGTQYASTAYYLTGKWRNGLATQDAVLNNDTKAAITIGKNQRFYWGVPRSAADTNIGFPTWGKEISGQFLQYNDVTHASEFWHNNANYIQMFDSGYMALNKPTLHAVAVSNLTSTTQAKVSNYISYDSGSANHPAGTLLDVTSTAVPLAAGLCVMQKLGNSLQIGANDYNYAATGAVAIKANRTGSNNTVGWSAGGIVPLCYDGSAWRDMTQ